MTVTINMTRGENHPPEMNGMYTSFMLKEDEETEVDILLNVSDEDGDILFVRAVSQPEHGRIEIINNGKGVSYIPEENWHGEIYFKFVAGDGREPTSESAEIKLNVQSVNDPPASCRIGCNAAASHRSISGSIMISARPVATIK